MARKILLLRQKNLKAWQTFAKIHSNWSFVGPEDEKKWRNVLWKHETKINLFGNYSARNVRRLKGKEFHVRFTKETIEHNRGSIVVWDCFSLNSVGPVHRISCTMTRFQYRDILENIMLPYASENMPLR